MYYVIEIAAGDSKIAGKAVYEYSTKDAAIADFHSKLGTAMKSELYTSEQILAVSDENAVLASQKWVRKTEE